MNAEIRGMIKDFSIENERKISRIINAQKKRVLNLIIDFSCIQSCSAED